MSRRVRLDHAAILDAAIKLVDEEGLEDLTLGRLAEHLGIRTPSLYNHIAGLAGLKRDLAIYSARELLARLTRATVGKSRAEAISAFADAYRAYAKEAPDRYALTLQAPSPSDQEVRMIAQQILEVALAVLAPYHLDEEEAVHAVRSLRSIVHGFISLEAAGGFKMPVDLDTSFHWLIHVFIIGLDQPTAASD